MRRTAWNFLVLLVFGVACIVALGGLGLAIAIGCAIAILVYTLIFRAT